MWNLFWTIHFVIVPVNLARVSHYGYRPRARAGRVVNAQVRRARSACSWDVRFSTENCGSNTWKKNYFTISVLLHLLRFLYDGKWDIVFLLAYTTLINKTFITVQSNIMWRKKGFIYIHVYFNMTSTLLKSQSNVHKETALCNLCFFSGSQSSQTQGPSSQPTQGPLLKKKFFIYLNFN